jgi:hypothetical protein
MNRIVEFYEANHLLVFIVVIIILGIYFLSIRKDGNYIKASLNKKDGNNKQIKINVELKSQKEFMEPNIYEYTATRFSFRRAKIDIMNENDVLYINVANAQIPENEGRFKITKEQIFEHYNNVIESVAYQRDGNYNYKTTPKSADQFRVLTNPTNQGKNWNSKLGIYTNIKGVETLKKSKRAQELKSKGFSVGEIAKELGLSVGRINEYLKK